MADWVEIKAIMIKKLNYFIITILFISKIIEQELNNYFIQRPITPLHVSFGI